MGDFIVTDSLTRLAADLGAVAAEAQANVRPAVEQSAAAVRDAWNGKLYREGHAKETAGSVSFDVTEGFLGVGADIGPKRGYRQAGIVLLLEVGSIHNAPHGYGSAAVEENSADFEARLGFAIAAGMGEHGL